MNTEGSMHIKILHLEDFPPDAELVKRSLRKANIHFDSLVVDNKANFEKALKEFAPDVILSDHTLPNFDSLLALQLVKDAGLTIPFILVTATVSEEYAVEVMKLGACDYILKDRLQRLPLAVVNAMEKTRTDNAHKETLATITQNEKKFRHTLDNMLEGIQIHDFNWRYVYVNDALVKYSTYTREELLGYTIMERYPGIEGTALFQTMKRCMDERVPEHIESGFVFPDGSKAHFELSIEPIAEGLSILSVDRTEQKKANEKLLKKNRLYAFISQINQSIVQVKDENELILDCCTIALEFGKFKIAWIGMFDISGKKMTIAGQQGIPDEEISLINNAPYQDNGPQDQVLQKGTYYISNEVQDTFELESWKPYAAKHGIHSCMVLPIKRSGAIVGTFNLYSTEPHFFDKAEIELLVEVASDISYALDVFENIKKQKETEERIVQNEQRFRALIENSRDMVTLSSESGEILYCSPSIVKVFGYSMEEMLHTYAFNFIHPTDLVQFVEKRKQILQTPGASFYQQQRLLHKKGNWIWCESTMSNRLHEPGIHALVANFRDISEKKEAKLRQEFDRHNLEALINNTKDLMWSVDRDFRLITSNKSFDDIMLGMFGKKPERGDNVIKMTLPGQAEKYTALYERAFSGETFTEKEHTTQPFEVWTEFSFYPIHNGKGIIGTACYSHDITQSKVSEKTIEDERILLRTLIDNIPALVYTKDTNSIKTLSNKADYEYLGAQLEEEVLGKDDTVFLPANLVNSTKQEDRRVFNTGQPIFNKEELRIKKDGGETWFLKSKIPLRNKEHSIIGLIGISHDITHRKAAEEQLKKSEAFSRGILDSLNSHIAVVDASGVIVAANETWKRFALENSGAILLSTNVGSNYYEACGNSNKEGQAVSLELLQGMKEVMTEKKSSFYLEYPCHSPNTKRWFGVRIIKFESDAPMIVVAHQNITERKLAEETVVRSEARLKEAQAIGHTGNWEINLVNGTHTWSDELYHIYGIHKEDVLPSTELFLSFMNPEEAPFALTNIQASFDSLKNASYSFRFIRTDGSQRYGYIETKFEFDRNNKPIRLYGILQDVTEPKLAELERTKITKDLIERNNDLQHFTYIVSHNLRAPVANIIGITSAINSMELNNKDRMEMMEHLVTSAKKMDDVIMDLNQILQVRHDVLMEQKETVSFSGLITDIRISISSLIQKEGVTFITDFTEIDEMKTLKSYLHSIFFNLISNSIKYRKPHEHPVIEISSKAVGNKTMLLFKDNGLGIDTETQKKQLFGLYRRFHTHVEGKGIGLYMVKAQVEILGGKICIYSEVNKGTEFSIQFNNGKH